MKINIKRFNPDVSHESYIENYEIKESNTALEALIEVKEQKDSSLAFRCGCKSGVCGSCAIKVNGQEKLACKTHLNENDLIEPLKNTNTIKDLVIDLDYEANLLMKSNSFLNQYNEIDISKEDEKLIDKQSNCILCQSCYSSCPVYEVNANFIGPYALTRALRYLNDKKEHKPLPTLEKIQNEGIWDCTLCGNCTMVCPQFIDPKTDIINLRMKSVQNGFEDKSLAMYNNDFNSGFDSSFNDDFGGFNPNGF